MIKANEIRNRITSIQATQQITKALKMIATTKLGRVNKKITALLPYISHLIEIFERTAFAPKQKKSSSVFLRPKPEQSILLTFFTTHRGFCGGLNKQVCQQVIHFYHQYTAQNKKVRLLPIGKKGSSFLKKQNIPYISKYINLAKKLCLIQIQSLGKFLLNSYKKNTYDHIILIYPSNINTLEQEVKTKQLLPIQPTISSTQNQALDYIYEPSRETIINDMIPSLIAASLYQTLLKATQAEHTARNQAMSKATDNADTLLKNLHIAYNRTRQTSITRQIIEIVASAEALKHI